MHDEQKPVNFLKPYVANAKIEVRSLNTGILMPSCRVTLGRRQGGVRCLLDTASTNNFITDQAAKRLKARPLEANLTMNIDGISGHKTVQSRLVQIALPQSGGDQLEMECLVVPEIGSFPPCSLSVGPSLAAMGQPADEFPRPLVSIDILIGQPMVNRVIVGKAVPIQVERGELKAWGKTQDKRTACMHLLPTLWGWTPSGQYCIKASPNVEETVFCSSTIQDIQNNMARVKRLDFVTKTNAWHEEHCFFTPTERIAKILEESWKIDTLTEAGELSVSEMEALDKLKNEMVYLAKEGKYQVPLLFKEKPKIRNNYHHVKARFEALLRRLSKEPEIKAAYKEVMQDMIDTDVVEEVYDTDPAGAGRQDVYWLPHRCVWKPESISHKCRVVMDASCRMSNNLSINDQLYQGPPLQKKIAEIEMKFRRHATATLMDVSKMFHRIQVDPVDRDFMRFLWKDPDQPGPPRMYRFKVVAFGFKSAPFLSQYVLQHHAKATRESSSDPEVQEAARQILEDSYVDDLCSGAPTPEVAYKNYLAVQRLLKTGNFQGRKWTSNSKEFLMRIPEEERLPMDEVKVLSSTDEEGWEQQLSPTTSLGIHWQPQEDVFTYNHLCNMEIARPYTKTTVASVLAKAAYDPLGQISPVVMEARKILKECWIRKLLWRQQLDDDLQTRFENWLSELDNLSDLTFPRYIPNGPEVEYHCMGDASDEGIGSAIYVRFFENGEWKSRLLLARSRIAQMAPLTTPKAEMKAAALTAELAATVKELFKVPEEKIFCWSDSQVVLGWLKKDPAHLIPYLSHRVKYIQDRNLKFQYVKSRDNSSDLASRGAKVSDLRGALWQEGPPFLATETGRPSYKLEMEEDHTERLLQGIRKQCVAYQTTAQKAELHRPGLWLGPAFSFLRENNHQRRPVEEDFKATNIRDYYSNWHRMINCLGAVLLIRDQFLRRIRKTTTEVKLKSREEYHFEATMKLVKWEQEEHFGELIGKLERGQKPPRKPVSLMQLFPMVENGYLRVGGRLQHAELPYDEKHQYILPANTNFVRLLIQYTHDKNDHCGIDWTLGHLRQRFWPLSARVTIKALNHQCLECRIKYALAAKQLMSDLPRDCVEPTFPFESTATDYFGPMYVKTTAKATTLRKVFGCLFLCMKSKAIHLELVMDNEPQEFLMAFKRFINTRSPPRHIFSDNAQTYSRANKESKDLCERANQEIEDETKKFAITWHFITPRSPSHGGRWERGVRTVKEPLRNMVKNRTLTLVEMQTALKECEGLVNDRVLAQLHEDSFEYLTPAKILIGKPIRPLPPGLGATSLPMPQSLREQWKQREEIMDRFWKSWTKLYLAHLQNRPKWRQQQPNLKPGQLVIMRESFKKRGDWPLALIMDVKKGRDGKVRTIRLKTKDGEMVRGLQHIFPLEDSADDKEEDVPIQDESLNDGFPEEMGEEDGDELPPLEEEL